MRKRRPIRRVGYRTKLVLQTLRGSTGADSRGHSQKSYTDRRTLYAHVEQLRGNEGILAHEIQPTATHRVECDYYPDVSVRSRFKVNGSDPARYLNVLSCENVGQRNRTLEVICVERIATTGTT